MTLRLKIKMADPLRRPASNQLRNARERVSKKKTGVPNKERSQSGLTGNGKVIVRDFTIGSRPSVSKVYLTSQI